MATMRTPPPSDWRAAWRRASSTRAKPSAHRNGEPRGTPSARPAADRLRAVPAEPRPDRQPRLRRAADRSCAPPQRCEAAIALQLLCPQIPLLFMGEECASRTPFLFFTDHHGELADAVREGRRREFASFAAFADPARRAHDSRPECAGDFRALRPKPDAERGPMAAVLSRNCSGLRRAHLMPRLAAPRQSARSRWAGGSAWPRLAARRWRGAAIAANFGAAAVQRSHGWPGG